MPSDQDRCLIEILARTEHCAIGYCRRCKLFHVDLGAVTLKLHTLQLHALGGGLTEALDAFKRRILLIDPPDGRKAEKPVH